MPRGTLDKAPGLMLYSVCNLFADQSATAYLHRQSSPIPDFPRARRAQGKEQSHYLAAAGY